MTQTTGGYSSQRLAEQAAECVLEHFTVDDAVALGVLATERARAGGLPIVIEVRHLGRLAYRVALPGSLPDSDDWIQRKARVVERYHSSTLAMRVLHEERGTDFSRATGLPEREYASGLPQVDDHEFLVACLLALKTS